VSSLLYRIGRWAYLHRIRVAVAWTMVLLVAGGGAALLSTGAEDSFSIPGTESARAFDQLRHTFPQVSGTSATLVVVSPTSELVTDPASTGPIEDFISTVEDVDLVQAVADPFSDQVSDAVSADRHAAIVTIQIDGEATGVPDSVKDQLVAARDTLAAALPAGSEAALGGALFSISVPAASATEGIGVIVALAVLVISFGSFLAAGMPLLNAILGVAVTMAGIFIMTRFTTIVSTTPMLAMMLGLAVGIDYTLLIVSRHRAQLRTGADPQESTARSLATAGSAVVFAGLTVMIALVGLATAQMPFLTVMGVAAAVGVGVAVLISLTLTPALLGFAGERLRPRRSRRAVDPDHPQLQSGKVYSAWIRAVTRQPVLTIVVVILALGALTLPAQSLRLALPDGGTEPAGSPARVTYDLIDEHFGPGYNGPLLLTGVIVGSQDPLTLMADLKTQIEAIPGVQAVPLSTPNADATMGVIQVIPTTAPDAAATRHLVEEIRSHHDQFARDYGIDLSVTGITAMQIDISARLGQALLPFGTFVVGLSIILLMMVFRSIWVPVTAAFGYVLSIGSAFGIVALVFEHGVGNALLGIDHHPQAVLSFMPIVTMGVLFGLAMDYEVFLVARMREEYVHGGDARRAVQIGFLSSAPVVTAAALIMFSVFIAFVPGDEVMLKPIALGLATGVAIDAFVVRMTLIPAVLHLLGDRAWHMPRALDRLLPTVDVEGENLAVELELADWPEPGSDDAVAAHQLRLDAPDGSPIYADVSVRLRRGETLLVAGPHRSGRTAFLLTLAGRAHATSGVLKVSGLVASVRASDIRQRVAFARLARTADPVGEVGAAIDSRAPIVVIDDLDAVGDPVLRAELRDLIRFARRKDPGLTLIVSALAPDRVAEILPPTHTLTLAPTLVEVSR
jgi:putative drug exporter of the RND superfamily